MVLGKYYVAGPCDSIVVADYPIGWETMDFEDTHWQVPKIIQIGSGRGYMHGSPWMLGPRNIPMMEQRAVQFTSIARQSEDAAAISKNGFSAMIPPNMKYSILLDQKELSMGSPRTDGFRRTGSNYKSYLFRSTFRSKWR